MNSAGVLLARPPARDRPQGLRQPVQEGLALEDGAVIPEVLLAALALDQQHSAGAVQLVVHHHLAGGDVVVRHALHEPPGGTQEGGHRHQQDVAVLER